MKYTFAILILVFQFTSDILAQDNECVFTTDTKPIAIDLISEFQNIKQWNWSESDSAIVAQTKTSDSFILSVNGCIHIDYNVNLYTSSTLSDWDSIRNKLLKYFTQKVNRDVYKLILEARKENIETINKDGETIIYMNSSPSQYIAENLIVSPIVIEFGDKYNSINLNWYYN